MLRPKKVVWIEKRWILVKQLKELYQWKYMYYSLSWVIKHYQLDANEVNVNCFVFMWEPFLPKIFNCKEPITKTPILIKKELNSIANRELDHPRIAMFIINLLYKIMNVRKMMPDSNSIESFINTNSSFSAFSAKELTAW